MDHNSGNSMEIPPLRSLDDYILESARFQLPNLKDLDKWGNRVVNNLLYYQTNYFFTYVIIFSCVGLMNPAKMIVGIISSICVISVYAYVSTEGRSVHYFKKKYPGTGIIFVLLAAYFLTYTLDSVIVFSIGIMLPFLVVFVHASLRLRSIKNKLVNKIEGIGLKKTPMGVILEHLGMEPQLFD